MKNSNGKRKVQKCLGRLDPGALYTVEGCLRFGGLGRESLMEARRSGLVHSIAYGRRRYYLGSELIEWLRSLQDPADKK